MSTVCVIIIIIITELHVRHYDTLLHTKFTRIYIIIALFARNCNVSHSSSSSCSSSGVACGAAELERKALVEALRDSNLPKLLARDATIMKTLLWDFFHVEDTSDSSKQDVPLLKASQHLEYI